MKMCGNDSETESNHKVECQTINGAGEESTNSERAINCVLCRVPVPISDQRTTSNVFSRLGHPPSDVITISKLATVTGASRASLHARGCHVCRQCHRRLTALHALELKVARERACLRFLFERVQPATSTSSDVTSSSSLKSSGYVTSRVRRHLSRKSADADQKNRRYECQVCGYKFRAFSHRVEHMLIHLDERPHACPQCPRTFRTRSTLAAHGRTHLQAGTARLADVMCPHCRRRLPDAAALRAHLRSAHPSEKSLACDTCARRFARAKDLALHRRQHTGERPHACARCSQTFVSRSRLNRHMLVHAAAAHVCAGCSRAFRRQYELRAHARRCGAAAAALTTAPAGPVALLSAVVVPDSAALYYHVVAPAAAAATQTASPLTQHCLTTSPLTQPTSVLAHQSITAAPVRQNLAGCLASRRDVLAGSAPTLLIGGSSEPDSTDPQPTAGAPPAAVRQSVHSEHVQSPSSTAVAAAAGIAAVTTSSANIGAVHFVDSTRPSQE